MFCFCWEMQQFDTVFCTVSSKNRLYNMFFDLCKFEFTAYFAIVN